MCPITPAEIAADIGECVDAGASIIHVHCRDQVTGAPIMDDPDAYVELFRTVEAETDALVYPTYPNGETVDRYKHVKALMEDPACGLEIAPIIAGSADLTPPLEYARDTPQGDWLLHMPLSDLFYQLALAREHDLFVSHDVMEPGGLRTVFSLFRDGEYVHPVLLKFFMSERMGFGFPPLPEVPRRVGRTRPARLRRRVARLAVRSRLRRVDGAVAPRDRYRWSRPRRCGRQSGTQSAASCPPTRNGSRRWQPSRASLGREVASVDDVRAGSPSNCARVSRASRSPSDPRRTRSCAPTRARSCIGVRADGLPDRMADGRSVPRRRTSSSPRTGAARRCVDFERNPNACCVVAPDDGDQALVLRGTAEVAEGQHEPTHRCRRRRRPTSRSPTGSANAARDRMKSGKRVVLHFTPSTQRIHPRRIGAVTTHSEPRKRPDIRM